MQHQRRASRSRVIWATFIFGVILCVGALFWGVRFAEVGEIKKSFISANMVILAVVAMMGLGAVLSFGALWRIFSRDVWLKRPERIVALGGGTGMPTVLRGLKKWTTDLVAVVTMADDGGSSGRLRAELDILPPGDVRNCLLALSESEPMLTALFQHRFQGGHGLRDHALGNLFLAALYEITGNFEQAIDRAAHILRVVGQVLPSTTDRVQLQATLADGSRIVGESHIGQTTQPIVEISLQPRLPKASKRAVAAILSADLIVIGPGSLYTSLLPNLLVPDIAAAILRSPAKKVYVASLMTQVGETSGLSLVQHIEAMDRHVGRLFDTVIVHKGYIPVGLLETYRAVGSELVTVDPDMLASLGLQKLEANLLAEDDHWIRHDPNALARLLVNLLRQDSTASKTLAPAWFLGKKVSVEQNVD